MKQRHEEEHVTVLLQVLASYINPNDEGENELKEDVFPENFCELLAQSALLPAISSYLRNDSGTSLLFIKVQIFYSKNFSGLRKKSECKVQFS